MANRWKGNIIAAAATTSSGTDYTGKANGAWGLNSQLQQKQGGLWAKGQTVPGAPTGVSAVAGYTSATILFTAPSNNGGSTITSYTVTSSPGNITATGSASPIVVPGLTNGTAYTFTVTATNSSGTSLPSSPSNSMTPVSLVIGAAYGGGYFAGKINISGTIYNLIVAPKATGEASGKTWGTNGVATGITSVINGPTNSASLAALGTEPAVFCEGLTIGGYSDWYLPAKNELEVLYYFLKPTTTVNDTSMGSNVNAVSPEPYNTTYTIDSPAQTSPGIGFRVDETNAFIPTSSYWSSTEANSSSAWRQNFNNGYQYNDIKLNGRYVRAVRRIAE